MATVSGHPASLQDCNRGFFASMKGEAPFSFPPATNARDAMKQAGLIRHRVNAEARRVLDEANARAKQIIEDAQTHARTIVINARDELAAGNLAVPVFESFQPDETEIATEDEDEDEDEDEAESEDEDEDEDEDM